ncbi:MULTISPECIES: TetR family transcriptional regulator [unclassified Microbacterium]|uniref:TetR family transcriptional regulator n=1 Tax=unclassified Microbacterium TaxID=2609290 RepID=UPI003665F7A5
MTNVAYERARSAAAKQEREDAILCSAAELGLRDGVRAVTLTDIAAGVGMHKSTMLRYFETREEIFLRLAAAQWREWSREVVAGLRVSAGGAARRWAPAETAALLTSTLLTRPLFCELLAHVPLNLERGVSLPIVKDFKLTAIASASAVADALSDATGLPRGAGMEVVATATAMAGALWQMAAPGTALRELYETDPELAHARVDVEPRLVRILEALITGLAG